MASTLKVNEIQHINGTSAMTIDTNGVVTKPQIPAWRIGLIADTAETTAGGNGSPILWDQVSGENNFTSGGISVDSSTGRITVPVTGIYQINANIRFDDIGSGYILVRIEINGDSSGDRETYSIEGSPSSSYQTATAVDTFSLTANDYIRILAMSSADTSWQVQHFSTCSGFLVG